MSIKSNFKETIIDVVGSLTKQEKMDFSNVLHKKSVEVSDLTKDHTVLTGVRHGNHIPMIDTRANYESFPFSNPNTCAVPECSLDTTFSTKAWELGLIECKIGICLREFDDDFLRFFNQYKMVNTDKEMNEDEYLQSAIVQYLVDKFKKNHNAGQWRGAYFGDKSSSSNLFNGINGFFTQAEANAENVIAIEKNQNSTYKDQALSGAEVYEVLQKMYEKYYTDATFSNQPVEFRMTFANAKQLALYFNGLKDKSCCNGLQILDPENVAGKPKFQWDRMTFHDIPIKVMSVWDEIINYTSELNEGFVGGKMVNLNGRRVNPNRILLTYKDNLLIGTSETENLSFFDIWHSQDQDKIFLKGGSYFGAGIPELESCIVAI